MIGGMPGNLMKVSEKKKNMYMIKFIFFDGFLFLVFVACIAVMIIFWQMERGIASNNTWGYDTFF